MRAETYIDTPPLYLQVENYFPLLPQAIYVNIASDYKKIYGNTADLKNMMVKIYPAYGGMK